jgi:hypothetical protein
MSPGVPSLYVLCELIFIHPGTLHAAFDLESLCGDGPQGSPELYDTSANDIKLRVEPIPGSDTASRNRELRYDVPRDASNNAIVGDSQNDENVIISYLHLAMLRSIT